MSRSQPSLTNPAHRFYEWSGSKGQLYYYDKEKAEQITVKLPFTFLVLDELATITGYSEQDESRYWSNEVRSVAKQELDVRTKKGTKEVGLYRDLTQVRSKGAKYAKSIYIAYYDNETGNLVMGNIKAYGAALTAWIEFGNRFIVANGKCSLTGYTEAKKGATTYRIPTFEWSHSTPEEDTLAIKLDKELQVYLSQYLAVSESDRQAEYRGESTTTTDERTDLTGDPELDSLLATGKNEINPEDLPVSFR